MSNTRLLELSGLDLLCTLSSPWALAQTVLDWHAGQKWAHIVCTICVCFHAFSDQIPKRHYWPLLFIWCWPCGKSLPCLQVMHHELGIKVWIVTRNVMHPCGIMYLKLTLMFILCRAADVLHQGEEYQQNNITKFTCVLTSWWGDKMLMFIFDLAIFC